MAFKIEDWNGVIDAVNSVTSSPPAKTDCKPLAPLPHVEAPHIWSVGDIIAVRSAIASTCDSIRFGELPSKWTIEILESLTIALSQAWCKCKDDDCKGEDGTEIIIKTLPPRVVSPCYGDNIFIQTEPLAPLINGMQVGKPNVIGRTWGLTAHRSFGGDTGIASGPVNCDGTVSCTTPEQIQSTNGVLVDCGDDSGCLSQNCQDALAYAATQLGSVPTIFYILTVFAQGAECVEEC